MTLFPSPVLKYNAQWFESLSDPQAIGVLLHELLHLLLLHPLRMGGRDPLLWAACCDMAVNDVLAPEMLLPDALKGFFGGLLGAWFTLRGIQAETVLTNPV